MSYANFISLVSGKRPIWLYEFTRLGQTVRFARSRSDIAAMGQTWQSRVLRHTRFMRTGVIEQRAVTELVFPQSDDWAQRYRRGGAYFDNSLTVWHGFLNDPDAEFVVKFRGRVVGSRSALTQIVLLAENSMTEQRRRARPAVMQRLCRHALYHDGCGLNIANFEISANLSALAGRVATVAEAAGQPDGYYAGGVLTYNGVRQSISRHSGSALTLAGSIPDLGADLAAAGGAGLSVAIAPGCTLTRATCHDRFDNLANFGGFPWIVGSPFDGRKLF